MTFLNTGSRLDNPYSSPRDGSPWKTLRSVPSRIWFLLVVLLVWLVAIVLVHLALPFLGDLLAADSVAP